MRSEATVPGTDAVTLDRVIPQVRPLAFNTLCNALMVLTIS